MIYKLKNNSYKLFLIHNKESLNIILKFISVLMILAKKFLKMINEMLYIFLENKMS